MGGVSVDDGGGGKGRRATDSEINMVPFIDLLLTAISFLLITAVWSSMARITADAQVPGPPRPEEPIEQKEPEKQLHVEMRSPEQFELIWKQGATIVEQRQIPRKDQITDNKGTKMVSYPELGAAIKDDWSKHGSHRDASDTKFDTAVLHTNNETPYFQVIAVIDAIYETRRGFTSGAKTEQVPAFNLSFAVN